MARARSLAPLENAGLRDDYSEEGRIQPPTNRAPSRPYDLDSITITLAETSYETCTDCLYFGRTFGKWLA